jgi:hypothetical protein
MNDNNDFPADLSAPARQALAAAGVRRLEELTGRSEPEIRALHGMGPKAVGQLRVALDVRGLAFARGGPIHDDDSGIPASMKFRTTVELGGKSATGLQVPDDVVSALASGKTPDSPSKHRWP